MSQKYPVKEVSYTALELVTGSTNILITEGNKRVVGNRLPNIGSHRFNIIDLKKGRYAFGCTTGEFNYAALLKTIKEAETSDKVNQVDGLKPKKGGNTVTKPIIEESAGYYIVEGGRAYDKAKYDKAKVDITKKNQNFGSFTWGTGNWREDAQYYHSGYPAGSKEDILEAMYKAKAIIEFLEDKGDYAPKKDEINESIESVLSK